MSYDSEIEELRRKKEAAIHEKQALERLADWNAFKNKALFMVGVFVVLLTALLIFGK